MSHLGRFVRWSKPCELLVFDSRHAKHRQLEPVPKALFLGATTGGGAGSGAARRGQAVELVEAGVEVVADPAGGVGVSRSGAGGGRGVRGQAEAANNLRLHLRGGEDRVSRGEERGTSHARSPFACWPC
jgi:hypothetical protein